MGAPLTYSALVGAFLRSRASSAEKALASEREAEWYEASLRRAIERNGFSNVRTMRVGKIVYLLKGTR